MPPVDPGHGGLPLEELLVAVLAQLPESVRLELPGEPPHARACARALGIDERLTLGAGRPAIGGEEVRLQAGGAASAAELIARLDPEGAGHAVPRGDDGVFAGQRVAIVTNVPAPYRHGLFGRIHERIAAAGGDLRVFFASPGPAARPWMRAGATTYPAVVMRSVQMPWGERSPLLPRDLERRLHGFRPTVLLHGGMSPFTAPRALLYAKAAGAAFGVWSGELPGVPTNRGRGRLRRTILSGADFAVAYGTLAAGYLRQCDFRGPLVVGRNTSAFPDGPRERPERPETVELITIADLASPRKGVDVLIDALALRPQLPCRLTVIGGGALMDDLRARAGDDGRVVFAGPLPHAEVQERILGADVYLTPTRLDIFGLAVLEAMGAGLAPILSAAPGMRADLAVDGRNCIVVADHAPASWADAIERTVLDHDLRRAMGEAARRTLRGRWSLDHAADAMIAGLRLGVAR